MSPILPTGDGAPLTFRILSESGPTRPTDPGFLSHSCPVMTPPPASVPAYASKILSGPNHSIHAALSQAGQLAAMCQTQLRDLRSYLLRIDEGNIQIRCIIVGTRKVHCARWSSIKRKHSSASNLGMPTT